MSKRGEQAMGRGQWGCRCFVEIRRIREYSLPFAKWLRGNYNPSYGVITATSRWVLLKTLWLQQDAKLESESLWFTSCLPDSGTYLFDRFSPSNSDFTCPPTEKRRIFCFPERCHMLTESPALERQVAYYLWEKHSQSVTALSHVAVMQ